jgi:hypothetical protein
VTDLATHTDNDGTPLFWKGVEYVPKSVYDRVLGAFKAKLREQDVTLAANITPDTWELWRRRSQ